MHPQRRIDSDPSHRPPVLENNLLSPDLVASIKLVLDTHNQPCYDGRRSHKGQEIRDYALWLIAFFYCHNNEVIDMAEQEGISIQQLKRQADRAVLDLIQCTAEKKETGTHQLAQCKALGKLAPLVEALHIK